MFAKVREHVGWDRYMGPGGEGGGVWHVEFWLGKYEGTKPLGRHTRLQDNMKTGLNTRDARAWTRLNWLSMGRSIRW